MAPEAVQPMHSKPVASDSVGHQVVQRMEASVGPSPRSGLVKQSGQMPVVTSETAGARVSPESSGNQFMPTGALRPISTAPNVRREAKRRFSETPSDGAIKLEREKEIHVLGGVEPFVRKEAVERVVREESAEMSVATERENGPARPRMPAIERNKATGIFQPPVESSQTVRISPRGLQSPVFSKTTQQHPLLQAAHSSPLPIHVQIGRVEVRDSAGPTPMPTKPTIQTPLGFNAYYRVRNYRS